MKKRNIIIAAIAIIVVVAVAFGIQNYSRNQRIYELQIPVPEGTTQIVISKDTESVTITEAEEIKDIIDVINGVKRHTTEESIQDMPISVDNLISIGIHGTDEKIYTVYAYEKKGDFYFEQAYNGIYEISPDEFNSIEKYLQDRGIDSLDDFYNVEVAQDRDIRQLPLGYSSEEAQEDGCFVITGAKVYNDNLYTEFVNACREKRTAFIRVVQTTIEGDLILNDVLYYEKSDSFYMVADSSRDNFAADENKELQVRKFENMAEYEYQGNLFWILYNGELNDETVVTDSVYTIAIIN